MRKRWLAVVLVLQFLLSCGGTAAAWNGTADPLPGGYENGEVLVEYADGTFGVLTFSTQTELAAGLEALAEDETVIGYQPNYSYQSSAVSDALYAQQWALNNDGSFKMEESENRHPVYETPFGMPAVPGQWIKPSDFGRSGGYRNAGYRTADIAHGAPALGTVEMTDKIIENL